MLGLHVALDGYLLAWMAISFALRFGAFGLIWVTAWKALGGMWAPLGPQMSYLALLCRREHQFEGPGGGGWLKVGRAVARDWEGFGTSCGP